MTNASHTVRMWKVQLTLGLLNGPITPTDEPVDTGSEPKVTAPDDRETMWRVDLAAYNEGQAELMARVAVMEYLTGTVHVALSAARDYFQGLHNAATADALKSYAEPSPLYVAVREAAALLDACDPLSRPDAW